MGLPCEETWGKEITVKREFFTCKGLLPVLVLTILVLVLAASGATAEHPKSEKPESEHPTEHPK